MNALSKFFEGRRRRLAVLDLKALPPKLLLDIGIEPDQVGAVASGLKNRTPQTTRRSHAPVLAGPGLASSAWPYPWRRAG